jgi:Spy/CpxP family protein refolding chaperone
MAKRMLEHLQTALNLTADQAKQVEAILKDQMQQGRAIRDNDTLSDDERMAKMQESRKASRAKIRALLTPDQQKIFDAMPPMGPHHGGPGPGDAPPPPPPAQS